MNSLQKTILYYIYNNNHTHILSNNINLHENKTTIVSKHKAQNYVSEPLRNSPTSRQMALQPTNIAVQITTASLSTYI